MSARSMDGGQRNEVLEVRTVTPQGKRVYAFMRERGPITDGDARTVCGVSRLSAIILQLKKEGVEIKAEWIEGKNRFGEITHFKRYWLAN